MRLAAKDACLVYSWPKEGHGPVCTNRGIYSGARLVTTMGLEFLPPTCHSTEATGTVPATREATVGIDYWHVCSNQGEGLGLVQDRTGQDCIQPAVRMRMRMRACILGSRVYIVQSSTVQDRPGQPSLLPVIRMAPKTSVGTVLRTVSPVRMQQEKIDPIIAASAGERCV